MATSRKAERSIVSHDEHETLVQTHQPDLAALETKDLIALQKRVRELRSKERTLIRDRRRSIRGKKEPRGGSFPGSVENASQRKQVFAAALKRVNSETTRRQAEDTRNAMKASLVQALERKRKNGSRKFPSSGRTSHAGMAVLESKRSRPVLDRADVGRAVQTTKAVQAKRDGRKSRPK